MSKPRKIKIIKIIIILGHAAQDNLDNDAPDSIEEVLGDQLSLVNAEIGNCIDGECTEAQEAVMDVVDTLYEALIPDPSTPPPAELVSLSDISRSLGQALGNL